MADHPEIERLRAILRGIGECVAGHLANDIDAMLAEARDPERHLAETPFASQAQKANVMLGAALRAAHEPEPEQWVRVEDRMPESGIPVLVFVTNSLGNTRRLRAKWIAKFTDENYESDDGDYDEATDTTYTPEGWYESNEYTETNWYISDPVTHWMPLPDGPYSTTAKSGDAHG